MRLLPTPAQWRRWSLIAKLTAIGAYITIIGLPVAIVSLVIALKSASSTTTPSPAAPVPDSGLTVQPQVVASEPPEPTDRALPPASKSAPTQTPIRETSASELEKHLRELPPLQRSTVERLEYLGRRVAWRGRILDIRDRGDRLLIAVEEQDELRTLVVIYFEQRWRFLFESFRQGDLVSYEGTIADLEVGTIIDGDQIRLEDSR